MMGQVPRPRLFLIDSYGFIFRAYHARARTGAPPMRTSTGLSTEAVFIFTNMLRKLAKTYKPEYIAAVFESLGPTLREQEFAEYKANRAEAPPDLGEQIPYVRRVIEALRIPILQYKGFEADDVIGTISRLAEEAGFDVVIVSSDKDMLQLVTDRVSMLNPAKDDTWYDPAKVQEFMGVKPSQVADLLALKGDSIDNIPGAPGIGDKGATDLIAKFGSVEAALDRAAEVERLRDYQALATPEAVDAWLAAIPAGAAVAVAVAKSAEGEFALDTVGLAWKRGEARAVPFPLIGRLRPLLEDAARPKIACDVKSVLLAFAQLGVEARGFAHDVSLYAFLLDADPGSCTLDEMAHRRMDLKLGAAPEQHADYALELYEDLGREIDTRGLRKLYETVELPLASVLARMELTGILIDSNELKRLSGLMETEIARLTADIHLMAGKPFNISSPQQLGRVLFEDLKLPAPVKYGKGKTISTAADVLDDLAADHEIVRKVLEHRQLTKLKGTYVDALPALLDPRTGRIHTSFNQTGAATGRLSSSNPNLQNIPIRTELGREIRAAFIPRPGWKLVVADYSQIELRLLAHMSRDAVLVEAFRNGEDIHTRTAAEVFGVPPLMVTPEHRRNAKAVNFGIVYGQTPFGLAQTLGIDRREAELYIRAYFERYSGVRRFLDLTVAEVRRTGVAVNLFGRRRPIPDMHSRNPNARNFAERTAVNTPLQGTAADLIKLAMIRIDQKLRGMQTKMLLQVHDELVFEAPPEEVDAVRAMVKSEMESVRKIEVPLLVDVGVGENWRDAKG